MKNKLTENIEQFLRSYSAMVDYWDEEAGDTHQMLSIREYLAENERTLSIEERAKMQAIDLEVLQLSERENNMAGWDTQMLHKTADVIRGISSERKAA
jgi:hypothetical protein